VSKHLLGPIGTTLNVDDRTVQKWIAAYGSGGGVLDPVGFGKLVERLLKDQLRSWFPTKLPAKAHMFVRKNRARLEDVYRMGRKLGEGSFGQVYSVVHRISGEKRVCKKISKLKGRGGMSMDEILAEIESMAKLDHPNVIKVFEYFDDRECVAQIMEPCAGGELQDTIDNVFQKGGRPYSEAFVCDVMKQLLQALAFMHDNRYMHKDLKPQNIMLTERNSSSIKVIDFGLAELFDADQKSSDAFGGTLLYMAPEVFKMRLVMKSDIWSAGVILYNLLTGDYPFMPPWPLPRGWTMDHWQRDLSRKIQEENYSDHPKLRAGWSRECLALLRLMLKKDVRQRPDAAGCLTHEWFRKFEETPPALSIGVTQCLEAFAGQPELKKAIFLNIAYMSTPPSLQELRAIFTHFDTKNNGTLSCTHLHRVLERAGMTSLQVEKIIHALDQDNSGSIEWTEFIAGALCVSVCGNRDLVEASFASFDKNNDGLVRMSDFADVFAKGAVKDVWERHLPEELKLLGEPGPGGTYTREQYHQYIGQRMTVSSGDALAAVS